MATIPVTPSVIDNRKDAIAAAVKEVEKPSSEEQVKVDVVEAKPKEKTKEEKEAEVAAREKKLQQAELLFDALNNPEQAGTVIDFLAKQAGYTKAELKTVETKTEVKEVKDDILEIFEKALGDEFKFLAPNLSKAVSEALNKRLESSQADIRAKFQEQEEEKLRGQSDSAINKLTEGFFGKDSELPKEVVTEMSKYMDRIQPNTNTTVSEYIEDAFHAAIGKLGLSKVNKSKQERISKNRTDAPTRLASERVPHEDNIQRDSKPLSRKDAIRAAVEALEKE